MPRPTKPVPSYRLHKQSGNAVVTVRTADGKRRDVLLGRYGTPESRAEYQRVIAGLNAGGGVPGLLAPADTAPDLTVAELVVAFWNHATAYYRRPDGTATDEVNNYRVSLRPLVDLYGPTPAREFGPVSLKAVRNRMIALGWVRRQINARVGRIRRVFKWAASEQLVPVAVVQALGTLAGLQAGRSAARERPPVAPVAEADARATMPHVRPEVAAMVEVQLLTGMRPGEACRLRPCDVDTSGPVWVYAPPQHKTAHRGKRRTVAIGPKAQAVLLRFWPADPAEYVFSPRRAVAALHAARAAARKTPKYPSSARRVQRVAAPKRVPAERYTASSYGHAVKKGVAKANARRARLAGEGNFDPVPAWHPNQLRHAHGTAVRKRYGLEAAGAALGHTKMSATEVYAERDADLAARVAAEVG